VGDANDFLWRSEEGDIVGFCAVYQHRADEVEICGMVHPSRRREGIFTQLLDEALSELRRRGVERVLLIVDRACEPGVAFALDRGGVLASSECRMRQDAAPAAPGGAAGVTLRPASSTPADRQLLQDCLHHAFGLPEEVAAPTAWGPTEERTLVIEHEGHGVGVIRAERDSAAGVAGVYGFAVLPEQQGQGYGRAALCMLTRQLHEEGFGVVTLEVLVDNPAALHLYETCGFVTTGVEDYYLLRLD
jgi:ribosomal protein S18 acetylase RimI-like enzyme